MLTDGTPPSRVGAASAPISTALRRRAGLRHGATTRALLTNWGACGAVAARSAPGTDGAGAHRARAPSYETGPAPALQRAFLLQAHHGGIADRHGQPQTARPAERADRLQMRQ